MNGRTAADSGSFAFLTGDGEMVQRIRNFDWSGTPLGSPETWSPALRTTLRIILANRFPHILWWGPEYVQFYNDAYQPIPGSKHPHQVLGRPAEECWAEIWHVIGPLVDRPFRGGPATWDDDLLLEVHRHGFLEECHFTIAYSPVPDETAPGGIGGVLATVHEITAQVVGERRLGALRELGARTGEAKTAEEACRIAAQTLSAHRNDIPFLLLYLIDPDQQHARLAGATDDDPRGDFSPEVISLAASESAGWPLHAALRAEAIQLVEHLDRRFAAIPPGPWSDPPHMAVVVPIPSNVPHEPVGFMVAGVSARLKWDDHYRDFLELAKTQIATAIANARAYEAQTKRAEALAQLDRAKTAFFSNVSHEFRTPLTLMLGPIENLLSHSDTAPLATAKGDLEVIQRNGLRLLRLVNSLLDFSRIEAGRMQANYEPTDLAAFTAELASMFRSACEQAGLTLTVDCEPLPETVFVDRGMWEKIVLNLLSNAFKFTFTGNITVTLRPAGERVELCIRDTGTGIPAEELPRVFERFYRIENARGRTHEGSGIGLALTRELVRMHGGDIRAASNMDAGSTFTVTIPLGATHLPPGQIGLARTAASTGDSAHQFVEESLGWLPGDAGAISDLPRTPRVADPMLPVTERQGESHELHVLVADDNADMRNYLAQILRERYEVEVVADGAAALRAARARPPGLVLADVMMPVLDGFGLLRELRADPKTARLPVILLSARAGEESRVDGMEAGADDYLIKPFSARELLARITVHLQMARLRRETEETLRQSSAQYKTLLDQAPLGVYLVDAEFRIREINPVALPVFSDIPGGVVGRDFAEVMHRVWESQYADEVVRIFRHTLQTGEPYFTPERAEFRVDRQTIEYYEWRADRIPLAQGRYGVVCYFRDISAQVAARRTIEESREALREADRRKDEFLAMLAHELRGPLAPISNVLELVRRSYGDSPVIQQACATMERQLAHLVRLVDDLLDISRISRNKLQLRKGNIELASVIRQAVETSRPLAERFHHEVTVTVPSEPIWLHADSTRLVQVFCNLLNNAYKYTEPGGQVWLSVEQRDTDVVAKVKDTGVGIPPDKLGRVFELFTQVDRSLGLAQGGLGIGLTLVKRLVQMHGGTITAFSDGVSGSEFVVRLPLITRTTVELPPVDGIELAHPASSRRVLIVDDDPDSAASLAMLLDSIGFETYTAHDGAEAVASAEKFRPDAVVLDIELPMLNGYEAAKRIREQRQGDAIVLIALTGRGQEEDRRKAKEAGFDAHLVKPVSFAELTRLLSVSPPRSNAA
jgi:PAS domain S-box-containing protein